MNFNTYFYNITRSTKWTFTRTVTVRQYKLQLFWSWREIISYHNTELLKEVLLNCILLLPFGMLLPIVAGHKLAWYKALIVGVLVSAFIEVSQLVLMRGLFEWDDMVHNGLEIIKKKLII